MSNLQIIYVSPKNLAVDVNPVDLEVVATFSDDSLPIKEDSVVLNKNVFLLDGDSNSVDGQLEVGSHYIKFIPDKVSGDTTYMMNILGDVSFNNTEDAIQDVDGNPFYEYYSWAFTTASYPIDTPKIISPENNTSYSEIPEIIWTESEDSYYEIQISDNIDFYNIIYADSTSNTSITPGEELEEGIYYTRVRAISDSKDIKTPWSDVVVFGYQKEIDDTEEEVIEEPDKKELEILETTPKESEAHVSKNLNRVVIKFDNELDIENINKRDIFITKIDNE